MASATHNSSPRKGPLHNSFTSGQVPVENQRDDLRRSMSKKMSKITLASMMSDYVNYEGYIPDDAHFAGLFDAVPTSGLEVKMYDPLVSALSGYDWF